MQTVNISDFRSNLLKYLEIAYSGGQLSITSNGKLLATITPPTNQTETARQQLREIAVASKIHDITSPIDSEWDAMS